mgnify:CR=1 FL=1
MRIIQKLMEAKRKKYNIYPAPIPSRYIMKIK